MHSPAPKGAYQSTLREAQAAGTHLQILEAVAALIEDEVEPTYAAIAKKAGVQERTVYRHFPSKDELYEAFWWRIVDDRLGKTGYDAMDLDSLVDEVGRTFNGFDRNVRLVVEMLHSKPGLAIRLRTNDRRQAMFARVVEHELPRADARTRRRAAAVVQLLYSGMAWHAMRAYWGMDATESAASVELALRALFEGLRAGAGARRRVPSARSKKKNGP